MAAKSKTNLAKIDKYVKGRLNASDMHELERETYDDAFLNEAMDGFEVFAEDDHEETVADLKTQLRSRVSTEKVRRVVLWPKLAIAASMLLILGVGYWFLKPVNDESRHKNFTSKIKPSLPTVIKENDTIESARPAHLVKQKRKLVADNEKVQPSITYKTDTVEYIANAYPVRANAKIEDILKKAEGFEVDTTGAVLFNGQPVAKARLNGKDYMGGDVDKAIKSLPADIVEKFQVVDDYGDQAGRTGIRTGEANKVLSFQIRNDKDTKGFFNQVTLYTPQVIYKEDTVEYITNNYPIQNEATILNVINRLDGFQRDGNELYFQGASIKKIQVNGIDDKGKPMLGITQKLSADVLEKLQVIDDYRDLATTSGIRGPVVSKVVNLVVREPKNRRLPWAHNLNGVTIPGDTVATPKPLIGWKKYADYVRRNAGSVAKQSNELMVFFYVDAGGKVSNIQVSGSGSVAQYEKAITIIKNGPAWIGYKEPRQIWLKVKLKKE